MKILQVVGDSKFGGATYLILEWCKFLVSHNCDVAVLSTDALTIRELKKIPGVTVIDSIFIPRDVAPMADLRALAKLARLIGKKSYDVIHTHTSTPGFIGRLAACYAGAPVRLHSAHGWPVSEFSSLAERILYTPLENIASRISTRVICVSKAAVDQGARFHLALPKKLVAVCNGIDPTPFLQASEQAGQSFRQELGLASDTIMIGNTSRLSPQKDVRSLVEAIPHLSGLMGKREFVVLLAGDGPLREELESLAARLAVASSIRFLGFRSDIPEFLAALDCFVSPSLWEGLSISLMEAMAAARPIVTTNIEPNAELIRHEKTGLLVPTRAPEAIAAAIARVITDRQLADRCAAAARARLLDRFTIRRMFDEQWRLYQELQPSRSRPHSISPREHSASIASKEIL